MTTNTWSENALVKRAARLADEAGEPTTLRTLEELLGIMNELEDRFPGTPFGDILADKAPWDGYELRRMRAKLRKTGATEADLAIVCPFNTDPEFISRKQTLASDPYNAPDNHRGGVEAGRL